MTLRTQPERAHRASVCIRAWGAVRLAALGMALAALPGCQSLNARSAQLRVIDASVDAGVLDAYQNNAALAYNLGFGSLTSYVPMTPGSYTLAADRAGTRQTLAAETATLLPGRQYTQIFGAPVAALQPTLLLDQSTPAPEGEVEFRFVHQASGLGPVDLYLVPAASSGRLATLSPVAVNLAYGQSTGYLQAPAGTYALDVVPTGTVLVSSTVTLMSGSQARYDSGAVRTVVLLDQETTGPKISGLTPAVQAIIAADADANSN